jgi:hypothetical protein
MKIKIKRYINNCCPSQSHHTISCDVDLGVEMIEIGRGNDVHDSAVRRGTLEGRLSELALEPTIVFSVYHSLEPNICECDALMRVV